jgi:hypothetical protein
VGHQTYGERGEDREGNIRGENGQNNMRDQMEEIRNWLREWMRGFHDWLT